jgi:hypothetical protein
LLWWGISKNIIKVRRTKDPQTPGQLAKTFYTEALNGNLPNSLKLLELLSPTAIESIEKPWDENLVTAWHDVRNGISHAYGEEVHYFPINRIVEKSTLNKNFIDVIVEIMYYSVDWKKYYFKSCSIFRLKNTAIKIDGKWRLTSPFPGKL